MIQNKKRETSTKRAITLQEIESVPPRVRNHALTLKKAVMQHALGSVQPREKHAPTTARAWSAKMNSNKHNSKLDEQKKKNG